MEVNVRHEHVLNIIPGPVTTILTTPLSSLCPLVESLCLAQNIQCHPEHSFCTDSNGTAYCQCQPGYFKLNPEDQSCIGEAWVWVRVEGEDRRIEDRPQSCIGEVWERVEGEDRSQSCIGGAWKDGASRR